MFRFEKLEVYQKSIYLANYIYEISDKWPKEYSFNLTDQLRRAVISISLNIAEGYGRSSKEFKRFLEIARGSCFECVPVVELAFRRGLLDASEKQDLYQKLDEIARMLSSLKSKV